VSARRNAINSKTMRQVRTLEKSVRKAIAGKNKDESAKALIAFESGIAKAAQKGRVHIRTATRKIGRMSKAVAALSK
jgi:small subunit ribosomal protein S20